MASEVAAGIAENVWKAEKNMAVAVGSRSARRILESLTIRCQAQGGEAPIWVREGGTVGNDAQLVLFE